MKHNFEKYCKDYKSIENYDMAAVEDFKGWHCHHRLETHNSDGERRDVDIPQKELIALGMYYNRPPEELIFLTTREHNAYNKGRPAWNKGKKMSEEFCRKNSESHKGKHASDETRRKMRATRKGEKHPMYGKHHSEETRKKMREAKEGENHPMYGKHLSAEHKNKIVAAMKGNTNVKGKHWFNNGEINIRAYECPEGFVPGRL